MEIMQAMLAGELPYPHIAETLDFALIAVEPGKATFQGRPQLKHCNPLGACRTWGVESENRPQRGQFLPDLQAHSPAMGQKDGEKWTAAVDLQPTIPKSDRLLGTVHGGWYATLLDSAVGCAVHTLMPAGRGYTTAELSINIVRAASHETGPLRAIGTVIHCGKQLATAEGRIVGPEGKLYAHATTTCLVFELPGRG